MREIRTPRLVLRLLRESDAEFILQLLNEPGWLRYIGDRNIHSIADARRYIDEGPNAMFARHDLGLYAVTLRTSGEAIGLCGLLRRAGLTAPDLGFALLEAHQGQGYIVEAGRAVIFGESGRHGLSEVLAVSLPENLDAHAVLSCLGFQFDRTVQLGPGQAALRLFRLSMKDLNALTESA
jgi:RimJ/RimL family protein N-acetyltransferase